MKGRGCKACDVCDEWGSSLQLGVASVLDGGLGRAALLDHRGNPIPRPPKLIGYERRVRFES